MSEEAAFAATDDSPPTSRRTVLSTLTTAVWLAILLGLFVQALILLAKVTAGGGSTTLQLFADVASGVTWSALVCSGVAIGTVAARHRGALMGLLGLVSAPWSTRSARPKCWNTGCWACSSGGCCARRPRRSAATRSPGSPSASSSGA